jgi:hypothetical protein
MKHRRMRHRPMEMVKLGAEDMSRFHRNAPAALARRGGNFFAREIAQGCEQMLYGCWPLVGILWLGWSTLELIFFFVVRMWVGILCDLAKLCTLCPAVMRSAQTKYDDWHVWVIAQALRDQQKELVRSHLRARYQPWQGVLVDFLFGGVATVGIAAMLLQSKGADLQVHFEGQWFLGSLLLSIVYPVMMGLSELVRHRIVGGERDVVIASGGRGIGLFLLMFVAVVAHEAQTNAADFAMWLMVAVNAVVIFAGALNVFGYWLVKDETRWLERYLREQSLTAGEEIQPS